VAGADLFLEGVRSGSADVDRVLEVRSVEDAQASQSDCLVIDSPNVTGDVAGIVDRCGGNDRSVPIVVLVADWTDDVLGALAAPEVVPLRCTLLESNADVIATRLVRAVEQVLAPATVRERYEQVVATSTT
jgi:hypothetical protein